MDRLFFLLGSAFAFLGVVAGAFGAHGLKSRLSAEMLDVFEVAVRYQMYHALALLLLAAMLPRIAPGVANLGGWLFVAGILIFSGSLYMLVFTGQRWLGAVTPLGGLAFLAGWICLIWATLK